MMATPFVDALTDDAPSEPRGRETAVPPVPPPSTDASPPAAEALFSTDGPATDGAADHHDLLEEPGGGSPSWPRRMAKLCLVFATVAALVALARFFDVQSLLEPGWMDAHLRGQGLAGVLLFLGLAATLTPLGVPRQALSALGGAAFGAAAGFGWASLGLTLGCAGGFFYARLLARSTVQRKLGRRIARLDAFLNRSPFLMAMAVRFFPFGNNALTNVAAGVTGIPALPFIAGSAVGYMPQSLIFALLGSGIHVDPLWRTALSAALFLLVSLFGFSLYRRLRKRT